MDRNKVLELAREIGAGEPESLYGRTDYVVMTKGDLERFAALIEREVRGDAEPVAWCWMRDGRPEGKPFYGKGPDQDIIERAAVAEIPRTVQYFYAHPAPAVVRQLVEAVDRLRQKAKWINDEQAIVGYDEMMELKKALADAKENGL